ncbi:MAG TPA: hypothetical protein VLR27_14070 [Acidimicrobiales bacterium]|nr:hypothetical protein [Acidimicrobiales bacterium]
MATIESAGDVVEVDDVLVTISPRPGRLARRRSTLTEPVTWPAPRTTVALRRTDITGQWQARFTYEGQTVTLVFPPKRLDELVAFADAHLGGMTNTVMDAEQDRLARRAEDGLR